MSKFRNQNTVTTEHLEREIGLYEAKEEPVAVIALRRLARDIGAPIRATEITNWTEVYRDELRRQRQVAAEEAQRKADLRYNRTDVRTAAEFAAKLEAIIIGQGDQTPDEAEIHRRQALISAAFAKQRGG